MKRAKALKPLSREHLVALLAARKLRQADDPAAAGREFLSFWEEHGRHHFRVEEEVLLPGWAAAAELDRPGVARMLEEHLAIRREAVRAREGELTLPELHALGDLLHDHVRFEERELFVAAEAALGPTALARLAVAIEAAEAAG
ncbi:MAG: hemerythrin domain-containing protein [Actinobacteria bacterium]|nr:hemerythrin domain-containing protein [Actinomycetota bacterium]